MTEVRLAKNGRVAEVILDRPDKMNAMTLEMFGAVADAARSADADPDVRSILIHGEGKAFSSGIDLSAFGSLGSTSGPKLARTIAAAQAPFRLLSGLSKPVVASVHGYALGAGLQLALAADIRFATPDSKWSVFEITYGLIPDLGATVRLPRLVGPAVAKHLVWTAEKFTGAEAERIGLVNGCHNNPLEVAREYASELADRPPLVVSLTKRLIEDAWNFDVERGMDAEAAAQSQALGSEDLKIAVDAAFSGSKPEYTGE